MNIRSSMVRGSWGIASVLVTVGCSSGNARSGNQNSKTPNGLGAICGNSTDCTNGLTCHIDTLNYVAHELCTQSCISDLDCSSKFGSNAVCVGSSVCANHCDTDSDCVSGTVCNGYSWCERGGPDSGVPMCTGTLGSCVAAADEVTCANTGCQWDGRCAGVALSCVSLSEGLCNAQSGCAWNSSTSSCSGVASTCSLEVASSLCTAQSGCTWSGSCAGVSLYGNCSDVDRDACRNVPGCSLTIQ